MAVGHGAFFVEVRRSKVRSMTERQITVTERPEIPVGSLVLGYGPASVIALNALAVWLAPAAIRPALAQLTIVWAAAILVFLGGVRRGLSFRTEGGPTTSELVATFVYFGLGFCALLLLLLGQVAPSVGLLFVGYAAAIVAEPRAARAGHAPLFFERLRPTQMLIAAVGLGVLFAALWLRH